MVKEPTRPQSLVVKIGAIVAVLIALGAIILFIVSPPQKLRLNTLNIAILNTQDTIAISIDPDDAEKYTLGNTISLRKFISTPKEWGLDDEWQLSIDTAHYAFPKTFIDERSYLWVLATGIIVDKKNVNYN